MYIEYLLSSHRSCFCTNFLLDCI